MRKILAATAAIALALCLALLVPLVLPPAAPADAGASPYDGTYQGSGSGTSDEGKKASSKVTVWVQDLGTTTRFTFRVAKLPVVVDAEGTGRVGKGGEIVVPLTIAKMGVRVTATMRLVPKGGTWVLTGDGKGKALKYSGSGKLACVRVSTGMNLPSVGTQITDTFSALFGGKAGSGTDTGAAGGGATGDGAGDEDTAKPAPEVTEEPASAVAPVKPQPPLPDDDTLAVTGALLFALTMSAIFGLGGSVPDIKVDAVTQPTDAGPAGGAGNAPAGDAPEGE